MQMHESSGPPLGNYKQFRVDEGQSTGEEAWKVREQRGLDYAPQEKPKKGFNQKSHCQIHVWGNFLALWWTAEEGKGRENRKEEAGF